MLSLLSPGRLLNLHTCSRQQISALRTQSDRALGCIPPEEVAFES